MTTPPVSHTAPCVTEPCAACNASRILRALAPRFAALPATAAPKPDGFTLTQAPAMLERLARKLEGEDAAEQARGVALTRQIGAGWTDPTCDAAKLWGEAVAAVASFPAGAAHVPGPLDAMRAVVEDAYRRGKVEGARKAQKRIAELEAEKAELYAQIEDRFGDPT